MKKRIVAVFLAVTILLTNQGFISVAQTVSDNKVLTETEITVSDNDVNVETKETESKKEENSAGVQTNSISENAVQTGTQNTVPEGTPANPVHNCTMKDDGTDTTTWSYVYFGSYPQIEITDSTITSAIDSAISSGNGVAADAGTDVWVNGTKYRRISKSNTNYSGYFNEVENNGYRYFKWERIKWRVLKNDGNTLFVVADKGLDCKAYNDEYASITWENSTVRDWLNNSFYQTAFSTNEQSAIVTQTVANDDNPDYGIEGGNNTNDKVYLLSIDEVTNAAYGFCSDYSVYSASRWMQSSNYARARGTYTYNSSSTGYNDNCW